MSQLEELKTCLQDLKDLRREIKAQQTKRIAKKALTAKAEQISSNWLGSLCSQVEYCGQVKAEVLKSYTDHFRLLLKLSAPNSPRTGYLMALSALTRKFRADLILPLHERPTQPLSLGLLSSLFRDLPSEEDAFLKESIGCAQRGFLRASVVLGWCAAIDRIHRKIDQVGFATFNISSASMASQQKGRFKKFNQVQNVSSMSDLREVFDNIVLWVLEGMGWIDSNQHTRLRSCFDMRCQSAHPGEAPITQYNLLSFYSDLKEIVFDNAKFHLATENAKGA